MIGFSLASGNQLRFSHKRGACLANVLDRNRDTVPRYPMVKIKCYKEIVLRKFIFFPLCFLGLTACVPATAIVTDYNGSSVTVVTSQFADFEEAGQTAAAEANRICQTGGASGAEYASTRSNPNTYENYHLYLCL
jgi:hypothetical protein